MVLDCDKSHTAYKDSFSNKTERYFVGVIIHYRNTVRILNQVSLDSPLVFSDER
jgi:hypothetical protein